MVRSVYIKQDIPVAKSASGFLLPESMEISDKSNIGTVVLVGDGTVEEPIQYKVGDKVMFNINNSRTIDLGEEKVKVVVDTDILIVL